ncbi:MAG: hypothetical protein N2317_08590 [Syntrophales bacterium]|nr:hypothetical protein [Syntrophales bacterium]
MFKEKEVGSPKFKERNMEIKKMRDAGVYYKVIAWHFGISMTRVKQIVAAEQQNEDNGYR